MFDYLIFICEPKPLLFTKLSNGHWVEKPRLIQLAQMEWATWLQTLAVIRAGFDSIHPCPKHSM